MTEDPTRSAIEADLGVGPAAPSTALSARTHAARADVARLAIDIRRHTDDLLVQSAPETIGQRVVDALLPSPIRKAKRRAEVQLVEARLNAGVAAANEIYGAQTEQVRAMVEVYTKSAKLQTAEEIAARGIGAATKVDGEIERSGAAFDRALEQSIAEATSLKTESARHAAADRIQRRIALRATVEEAAMERVRDAISPPRGHP